MDCTSKVCTDFTKFVLDCYLNRMYHLKQEHCCLLLPLPVPHGTLNVTLSNLPGMSVLLTNVKLPAPSVCEFGFAFPSAVGNVTLPPAIEKFVVTKLFDVTNPSDMLTLLLAPINVNVVPS